LAQTRVLENRRQHRELAQRHAIVADQLRETICGKLFGAVQQMAGRVREPKRLGRVRQI